MTTQHDPTRRSLSRSPDATAYRALRTLLVGGLLAVRPVASQVPSPAQAQSALQQALQQNPGLPDVIRQRLQQSGLTPDQIRARLQASGYPPNLLDAYLSGATPAVPAAIPGANELAAIQALGLAPIALPGPALPVDTGLVRARGAAAESTSPVFGVDVFRRTTTQFLPLLAGPVPPDYKLGPGDQLVLILTGDVELAYTLAVTREGFILMPQVGQVFVSNLTLDQLRDLLYTRLGRVYSGVKRTPNATTRLDVTVANVRTNQVYVVGEVNQPGAYQISSLATVLTALYAAGGVTERANMRDVELRRLGKPLARLDLYDYLLRGDTRNDVRLETGDVVFMKLHGPRAQVTGAVRRPAIYDLGAGERLGQFVLDAGGFEPDAQLKRLSIFRVLPAPERGPGAPARTVIDVPLIAIPPSDPAKPWASKMDIAIGADLREAEIARMPEDRSNGQLATTIRVPMDSTYLFERDSSGRYMGPPGVPVPATGAPEVKLQPFDNILILREPGFDFQRNVWVTGEVRYPGTYSLHTKSDRLADVIGRAGGLTPQAYGEGIRFMRKEGNVGRINVELRRALEDKTSRFNILLQPADSIEIPEYEPSVKVAGAVNSPGSVLWEQGRDLDYYISAAGGFAQLANKGAVSVRYANGEVRTRHRTFFGTSNPKPGPGSEVSVPAKDPNAPHTDYVALFGAIAQVLASTVAIIVVATKL